MCDKYFGSSTDAVDMSALLKFAFSTNNVQQKGLNVQNVVKLMC